MKKSREFSRTLFAVKNIKAGEVFTEENVRSARPGYGMYTRFLKNIMGRKATRNIERGTPLDWELISYD